MKRTSEKIMYNSTLHTIYIGEDGKKYVKTIKYVLLPFENQNKVSPKKSFNNVINDYSIPKSINDSIYLEFDKKYQEILYIITDLFTKETAKLKDFKKKSDNFWRNNYYYIEEYDYKNRIKDVKINDLEIYIEDYYYYYSKLPENLVLLKFLNGTYDIELDKSFKFKRFVRFKLWFKDKLQSSLAFDFEKLNISFESFGDYSNKENHFDINIYNNNDNDKELLIKTLLKFIQKKNKSIYYDDFKSLYEEDIDTLQKNIVTYLYILYILLEMNIKVEKNKSSKSKIQNFIDNLKQVILIISQIQKYY